MRCNIFKTILLLFIAKCYGQNDGGCEIDGISNLNWAAQTYPNDEIRDVDILMRTFPYTGTLEIKCSDCKYVNATAEGGVITFTSTTDFYNFDRDQPQSTSAVILFYTHFTFTCKDGDSKLSFLQPVRDTNNHVPTFENSVYEYQVVNPILPGSDITFVGKQILITDLDFSNQNITFTIEPPDSRFVVETIPLGDKFYKASITVSEVVNFDQEIQFTLRGRDGGYPSNSAVTTVRIMKSNNNCSESDFPKFSRVYYDVDYYEINGDPIITINNGPIVVFSKFPQQIQVSIKGSNYFYTTYDAYSGEVVLQISQVIRNPGTTVIELELTALGSTNSESCTVLVHLPKPPKFSKPCYKGDYKVVNNMGQLVISERLSFDIQYQGTYTLRVSEFYASYLDINLVDDDILVTLIRDLDSSILDNEIELLVTLEATLDSSDVGVTTLLIHLPSKALPAPPTFSRTYYSAIYINEFSGIDRIEVTTGPIEVNSNRPDDLIMIVTGDYADHFGTQHLGNEVFSLVLISNFEDEFLVNNQYIIVFLEIYVLGEPEKGIAAVTIACPTNLTRDSPKAKLTNIK